MIKIRRVIVRSEGELRTALAQAEDDPNMEIWVERDIRVTPIGASKAAQDARQR